VRREMLIERHLVGAMASPPEPVPIAGLVDGDAINPGAEARLTAEAVDRAENAEEDFLGEVERLVAVAQQVHRQLHDHALVLGNQFRAGKLFPGGAALDQHRLAPADVGPTRNPRLLHRDFHYTKLDPGRAGWFRWR
jgi:hypothetical protein